MFPVNSMDTTPIPAPFPSFLATTSLLLTRSHQQGGDPTHHRPGQPPDQTTLGLRSELADAVRPDCEGYEAIGRLPFDILTNDKL